mmetsp:Transcript_31155/g.72329  ORF Transcript_31155/g.72329 Transcript_31155/m.72329 type:complete len:211 (+) Transcript_31155:107-739(+)
MAVEAGHGECFFCIPLRPGVALIALAYFLYAFDCVYVLCSGDVRVQSGGYSPWIWRIQAAAGSAGLLFGFLGMLGVNDGKVDWIRSFAHFQEAKLAVMLLVFVFDVVALSRCATWVDVPGSKARNAALYAISSKGLCSIARMYYSLGFVCDFAACYYFTWATRRYCRQLEAGPACLIHFPSSSYAHVEGKLVDGEHGDPGQHLGPSYGST